MVLLPGILYRGLAVSFTNLQYSYLVDEVGSLMSLCHGELPGAIGAPG